MIHATRGKMQVMPRGICTRTRALQGALPAAERPKPHSQPPSRAARPVLVRGWLVAFPLLDVEAGGLGIKSGPLRRDLVGGMGVHRATASKLLLGVTSILLVVSVSGDVCGEPCITTVPPRRMCLSEHVGTRKRVLRAQIMSGLECQRDTARATRPPRTPPLTRCLSARACACRASATDRRSHRPGTRARVSAPGTLDVSPLKSTVEGDTLAAWFRAEGRACVRGLW
jgi:hypothetical protein